MSKVKYNTRQKQLVFEAVRDNCDKQLSCDEITFILASNGTPVGKTTVYRQLEKFVNEGIVRKINAHNSKSFVYQYVDKNLDCDSHLHLRCTECGEYVHLGCDFISKVNEHIFLHHNFTVDNSHTEIVGICGKCSAERAEGDFQCH